VSLPIETRTAWVQLDDRGVVLARAKPQAALDLADAREVTAAMFPLVEGATGRILIDLREVRSMSRECREYFAGRRPGRRQMACALLVRTPLGRAIGNFFMGINKPIIPTRMFTLEEEALRWLAEFLPGP
jgi:hypothetical protein